MQYLLTEKEYNEICTSGVSYEERIRSALQAACMLAAKHTPIAREWAPDKPPSPWGCILDADSNPGYCDECPVQALCPHDDKEWSK